MAMTCLHVKCAGFGILAGVKAASNWRAGALSILVPHWVLIGISQGIVVPLFPPYGLCSPLCGPVGGVPKVRVVLKYRHCDGNLCIKVTDDVVCLLYRTDQAQDVKKIEKFHSQLMRLMVARESRSAAMETD
uniref:Signal recognition particle 9 kDa protein n=1 Tax=Xenopus tropicalis TaxID=8364 RepID=A0A803J8S6_XENTR